MTLRRLVALLAAVAWFGGAQAQAPSGPPAVGVVHATRQAVTETSEFIGRIQAVPELFKLLAQRGDEPSSYRIVPFGGAGPTHAVMLAAESGMMGIAVPPAAATFCALGGAMADVRREFVRGLGHGSIAALGDALWHNWRTLEKQAEEWLEGENIKITERRLVHALDMRYAGQSFSITTTIPEDARYTESAGSVLEAFHRAHELIYGFREQDAIVEAVTQRLSIIGYVPKLDLPRLAPGTVSPSPRSRRDIFHEGGWIDAAIYRREDFGDGSSAVGPAIIEQDDTCLWVPPGWMLRADQHGILMVERDPSHAA